jgi:predicted alpha/beta hydrolase
MSESATLAINNIQLRTQDNTLISAKQYLCDSPKAYIVIAGATGVPQGFYARYSKAANTAGFNVLTLDYRGVGESKPASLKNYEMSYLDWGEQDLAAAVEKASELDLPLYIVGHSYGGQAVGLLPKPELVDGAYVFGTGAGWSGWMPPMERFKVNLMWKFIAPVFVRLYGYLAWSRVGMGEDLPLSVYKQWKRWCQYKYYFFDDPEMQDMHAQFSRFNKPLVAVTATDDKWATPASRDAFFQYYKQAELVSIDLIPSDVNMQEIGHMGYFKKPANAIWQQSFDWIDEQLNPS